MFAIESFWRARGVEIQPFLFCGKLEMSKLEMSKLEMQHRLPGSRVSRLGFLASLLAFLSAACAVSLVLGPAGPAWLAGPWAGFASGRAVGLTLLPGAGLAPCPSPALPPLAFRRALCRLAVLPTLLSKSYYLSSIVIAVLLVVVA